MKTLAEIRKAKILALNKIDLIEREKLLALYQGVVNDNVYRVMALRGALKASEVPVVALGGIGTCRVCCSVLRFAKSTAGTFVESMQ